MKIFNAVKLKVIFHDLWKIREGDCRNLCVFGFPFFIYEYLVL